VASGVIIQFKALRFDKGVYLFEKLLAAGRLEFHKMRQARKPIGDKALFIVVDQRRSSRQTFADMEDGALEPRQVFAVRLPFEQMAGVANQDDSLA
jgi:hypothetical protein